MRCPFQKITKNSVQLERSELELFVYFDPSKFVAGTPVTTTIEQLEQREEIDKFLQFEQQPTLLDIEYQLSIRQAVSERKQALMAKVMEALTSVHASEIDFRATNIPDEQNGESHI
ncbi:MAG: hypothetical protein EZS28_032205 [Streblomastix strix]|uniref:Uncharacterized protein n=1 Tax=Streblomastix strix TaxID=222440 RepID=A0A5J4UPB1_9EUKA|nr:MAG: hypothetical protein EZS28_032205 [Streblomastix strix]